MTPIRWGGQAQRLPQAGIDPRPDRPALPKPWATAPHPFCRNRRLAATRSTERLTHDHAAARRRPADRPYRADPGLRLHHADAPVVPSSPGCRRSHTPEPGADRGGRHRARAAAAALRADPDLGRRLSAADHRTTHRHPGGRRVLLRRDLHHARLRRHHAEQRAMASADRHRGAEWRAAARLVDGAALRRGPSHLERLRRAPSAARRATMRRPGSAERREADPTDTGRG